MQWFTYFIIFLSLNEEFEASENKQSMDILNCLKCGFKNCPEEYNCFKKETVKASVHCKIGNHTRAKELQCRTGELGVTEMHDCLNIPLPVKTQVTYTCPIFYNVSTIPVSICESDGTWSEPIKCIPDCGKAHTDTPLTPLILNGRQVPFRSQWPWAAALYLLKNNSMHYTFFCGATLVGDNLIVTAATCTYGNLTTSNNLLVVLGEFIRKIPKDKAHVYGYKVKRTYLLPVYKGLKTNYNSDISILVLEERVQFNENRLPACLPSRNNTVEPFTPAIVAGWGYPNVNKINVSDSLIYMKVPIIDTYHCSKKLPVKFDERLAFTTFCAGYTNGTGICVGDTGNGLLTVNPDNLWELQGIVTVNPVYTDAQKKVWPCHPKMYSLYTKVYLYLDWIEKIVKFEELDRPDKTKP